MSKKASKIGEKRNKERLGDFCQFQKSGEIPLQMTIHKIWEETEGRWFEFEFDWWEIRRLSDMMEIILCLNDSNRPIEIVLFNEREMELYCRMDFTLEEWLRQKIWDGLYVMSELPKGCLAVYESERIG